MSSSGTRRQINNSSALKDRKTNQQDSLKQRKSNQEIDQSGAFTNKNEDDSTIDQNKSLYSLKNSQYLFDKTSYKKGSILQEDKQLDYFDVTNVRNVILKERKTPTDLINLGVALKNYWFFDDYKKTLPFSNYLQLLKSIEYQFVRKGEIVYSIGQKSTEMYVVLEGSFFVLIRNPKSLVVYNTPRAAQQQLESNQQANNGNGQQQQPQGGNATGEQTEFGLEKEAKNVDFSQAWEYIQQQTLQDEINKKINGPLEWFEISEQLSDTILVDSLKLGSNFGEFELMYNKLRSQIIIAREDSHLIKINQHQYEMLPKEKNQKEYNSSLDFLYSFDFFHDWGRQMMNLLVCFEISNCYLNQVIYKEQEESDYLYFVYSGEFEITKKIKADENHQKVLELANIPLFNYKKNVKSQIKHGGDYSERMRLCIYGQNTYFGDDELLNLERRKTQATCISQEGVLYKLSLKKLVKIVCNQNNIWELLQDNLKVKRKWQKEFFSHVNEVVKQNDGKSISPKKNHNQSDGLNHGSIQNEELKNIFQVNDKYQSKSYYKGFKDNYVNSIQNVYQEAANNIINLQQKKSFSPRQLSPTSALKKRNFMENFTQKMNNAQEGNSQNAHLLNYNDDYILQNSPIQTTRYFNLKQELLNKQFFQERSKDLIQMQQNMVLVKRFKEHQKLQQKSENEIQNHSQFLSCQSSPKNKQNDAQTKTLKAALNLNGFPKQEQKSPLTARNEKERDNKILKSSQDSRKKQKQSTKLKENSKEFPKSDNLLDAINQKDIIDKSSIIRKEDLPEFSPQNKEKKNENNQNGIQIDLRIFHENTNEENFEKKKDLWDHLQSSKEKLTSQQFFDQLLDAVNGGKRPQTKGDIRSKTMYKGKMNQKRLNQSLNTNNLNSLIADSSIQQEQFSTNIDVSQTRSITPLQQLEGGNQFRQYYNQNKDKQIILDKLKFYRLMKPHIDEKMSEVQSDSLQGSTMFSNQLQISPVKTYQKGSQTSRDNQRSKSSYQQSSNSKRRNSHILELQQELFGNLLKTQVLKQQQFVCLGNQPKQNTSLLNEFIDANYNFPIQGYQNQSFGSSSIFPLEEKDEFNLQQQAEDILQNKRESISLSPLKRKTFYDEKLNQKKLDHQVNNKLNMPAHNRIFKEGDNIYIKTGGFTIKKPCPQRFLQQV